MPREVIVKAKLTLYVTLSIGLSIGDSIEF